MSALDDLIARDSAPQQSGLDAIIARESSSLSQAQPNIQQQTANNGPSILSRIATGIADPAYGVSQLAWHAFPNAMATGMRLNQALGEIPVVGKYLKVEGAIPQNANDVDKIISQREQNYQESRKQVGQNGIDWARGAGNVLATAPIAAVTPIGSSLGGSILSGGLTNAGISALSPVTQGNFEDEKLRQVIPGTVLGAALGGAGNIAARTISPNISNQVKSLMAEGVTPTPGQILGGSAATLESKATSIPFLGDMIKNAQDRVLTQFNQAAYNRALSPIGEKITSAPGREAVEEVSMKLGKAYDDLLPKLSFKPDAQFSQELSSISQMASQLPAQQSGRFQQILRDVVTNKMTPQGNMSGTSLKAVESDLGRLSKIYKADSSSDGRLLGDAIGSLQDSIRNTLTRTNPEYAKQLQAINTGYANFARIRDAASRIGAEEGVFSANQLQSAVRAADKSVGKGQFAKGNALMQDLSEAGISVISPKYNDSGTAGRILAAAILGGAAAVKPLTLALVAGASAPYTQLGARLAAKALTNRPEGAKALAESVRRTIPYVGIAGIPLVSN